MADGASSSAYTSKFTASCSTTDSERDYCDPYDIALIYNTASNLNHCVTKAKDILQESGYNVKDSRDHGFNAGQFKAQNHIDETVPAKYRIVIFNMAYKKHDLPVHGPMLYNRKFTTLENTLIVLRKKHVKKLPDEIQDLQRRELENVTGTELAEIVMKFVKGGDENPYTHMERYEDHYKSFHDIIDNFSTKRSFILIANVAHPVPTCVRHLARVPWLKVFDFDHDTTEGSLLSVIKPYLVPGKFAISASEDDPRKPSDKNTDWCRWSNAEGSNSEVASDAHVSSISQYCSGQKVTTLMILWYTEDNTRGLDFYDLVRDIKSAFRTNRGIKCVLCTAQVPDDGTTLNRITRGSNHDDFRLIVPLSVLALWVEREMKMKDSESNGEPRLLPSYKKDPDHDATVSLSERHYNWLSADMDVLAFNRNLETREPSESEGADFLQGGTISWRTLEDGAFDARRGIMQVVIDYIKEEHIEKGLSGPVYVHHHPGSGGTTFGRRVLWEMRKIVPCISVHPPFEDTEEFREKIKFVRNHTNITVLLLMDGKADVEKILTALSYERVVILNIVRYYGSMENRHETPAHFYLRDEITKDESAVILPIYSRYGQYSCEELRQRSADQKTFMYEYGLMAFNENFFGVRRYVQGHLNLEGQKEPWHYVIGFLSLALHYSQKMLPCEMFSSLLKTKRNSTVKKTDIPFNGRQLVKEDGDKWSISYTEVAREILKQLLTKDGEPSPTGSRTLNLTGAACDELKDLSILFIQEMRRSLAKPDTIPRHKLLILQEVFILRNETHEQLDKNPVKYAMLLRDVDKNESRGDILKMLVECFPKHADFHAHLGRYYGKSDFIDEAEKSFQKAVDVRMDELALHHGYQESDEVLQRVHHMFGFFYFSRIPTFANPGDHVEERDIMDIIQLANNAISQFEESRKYFVLGTNPTYGLLGEVKVRVRVGIIARDLNLLRRNDSDLVNHLHKLREFSWQSFGICDHLLAQCIEQATEHEIQNSELGYCTSKLMKVFKNSFPLLEEWTKKSSTLSSKLCEIAVLKQHLRSLKQHLRSDQRFSVFSVHGQQEKLQRLLLLYEAVIKGTTDIRKRISSDMLDWLKIIRRAQSNYSLQTVLELVEMWDRRSEKNSLSTYYLYVLNVVLAISFPGANMSQIYRQKAEKLREKLGNPEKSLARHVLFRSHEWLGTTTNLTINTLVHRDVLGPINQDIPSKTNLLRRCTGTIKTVKNWFGWLLLDGFSDPPIEVFFTPKRYGLTSQHANENVRAEFYLGFNPRHGSEAFDLEVIETRMCPCGNATEVKGAAPHSCRICGRHF